MHLNEMNNGKHLDGNRYQSIDVDFVPPKPFSVVNIFKPVEIVYIKKCSISTYLFQF